MLPDQTESKIAATFRGRPPYADKSRYPTAARRRDSVGYFDSIYATDLLHRDRAVYMYLKSRANQEGVCWPFVRMICADLDLSRATVQRAPRDLQRTGGISLEPRRRENGGCSSNFYHVR